ncbi:hypothetical protein C2G38_2235463 [Gigaspora rosea]|uniref:Uncharacterized protein n=1 Tax=Gigaspora rosea TaxID=44941 RepID=A0A397TRT2_9GLOM|nr:hypothetical protein C2G38_2235463 [Gigaspora rosea]
MQPYKIFIVFLLVLLIAYSTIVLSNYEFNRSELKGNKPEEYKLEERLSNVALNLSDLFRFMYEFSINL